MGWFIGLSFGTWQFTLFAWSLELLGWKLVNLYPASTLLYPTDHYSTLLTTVVRVYDFFFVCLPPYFAWPWLLNVMFLVGFFRDYVHGAFLFVVLFVISFLWWGLVLHTHSWFSSVMIFVRKARVGHGVRRTAADEVRSGNPSGCGVRGRGRKRPPRWKRWWYPVLWFMMYDVTIVMTLSWPHYDPIMPNMTT